jgi:hypothetical protein
MSVSLLLSLLLTNFGRVGVSVEKHTAAIGHTTRTPKEAGSHGLTRLHCLQSKISPHGLRDVVAIVTVLNALLRYVLNLRASAQGLVL